MMTALSRAGALAVLMALAACGGGNDTPRMNLRSPSVSQAALHPNETPELRRLIHILHQRIADLAGAQLAQFGRHRRAGLLGELQVEFDKALAGGGEKYVARHRKRGKMTARERIEMLLDEENAHLAGLSDFIGKPISLQAEGRDGSDQYDIILL